MAKLPSEIMYDILSRMPVKSLARFRCVSKRWRNYINDPYLETMHAKQSKGDDPMLIVLQQYPYNHLNVQRILSFLEYKEEASTSSLEVRKKHPVMKFMCQNSNCRYPNGIVLGSCNGLIYTSKVNINRKKTLVVINPLRKESYKLPPMGIYTNESFGLGFDESTNTFKMVCVLQTRLWSHYGKLWEKVWTKVHVLGTGSWRKILQVPCYHITGEGLFANGCLHWLMRYNGDVEYPIHLGRPVISFDMAKEEFGLINPPRERPSSWTREQLVVLHGDVGYINHIINNMIEVWVLKEKVWLMHCRFELKPLPPFCDEFIKVLGFWNGNGDVLMTSSLKRMFVYSLNRDSLDKVSFVGWDKNDPHEDIRMFQSSLFSTRYSIINLSEKTLASLSCW